MCDQSPGGREDEARHPHHLPGGAGRRSGGLSVICNHPCFTDASLINGM